MGDWIDPIVYHVGSGNSFFFGTALILLGIILSSWAQSPLAIDWAKSVGYPGRDCRRYFSNAVSVVGLLRSRCVHFFLVGS